MQVVLRGVASSIEAGDPFLSFVGPGLPVRPFWSNFNNTVPGSNNFYFSWDRVTWDEFSRGVTPPGWTVYQATGGALIPPPVAAPDPTFTGGLDPYEGFVEEGYLTKHFNSLNNLEWFAGRGVSSPDPSTGLTALTYDIYEADADGDYPAYIRDASHLIYTEQSYVGGYGGPAVASAAFVDIIDGSSIRTFDLSTAVYMPSESEAQSIALWDGSRIADNRTYRIYSLLLGSQPPQPPDIFWTQRILCEETQ